MSQPTAELSATLRRVLDTYYNAADSKDFALISTVFAENAVVTYHVGTPQELRIEGRGAVVAQLDDVVSKFTASTHILANFHVEMTQDGPRSVTHAIANVVLGERILARGLRYIDLFVEEEGAWRIAVRQHMPMWQYDVAGTSPVLK
jgi:hypothetical protein